MKYNVKAQLDDFDLGIIAYLRIDGAMNPIQYFPLAASAINYLQKNNVISKLERRECAEYFCQKFTSMLRPATVSQSVIDQTIALMVNQKDTVKEFGGILAAMKFAR